MKIDRLIGIIIYLLNRDIVNSRELSEKFEVSYRTIQRDIETLNLSGIPIISIQGVNGGYKIEENFKIKKQHINKEDYNYIIAALKGLDSGYNNRNIKKILEQITYYLKSDNLEDSRIKLDLSVLKENKVINENLKIIEKALENKTLLEFSYFNSYNQESFRIIEPIGLIYKWYSWYVLGYCLEKKDYRLFKVVRIKKLNLKNINFSKNHDSFEKLVEKIEKKDISKDLKIKIRFEKEILNAIEEYFPNAKITILENGNYLLETYLPDYENVWKGIFLSFGNKIEILEPENLKQEFLKKAEEIIFLYKNL